ncbi:MAG: Glu-tRNA(Gln) amidotransferase subunit GatE [Nanobdellota archaeon]
MATNTLQLKTTITDQDLNDLKLTCGLEIHQQLECKKLFCNCPTLIRDDDPDFTVKRLLRASAGESGQVDKAASAEMKKKNSILYQGYDDTTCLVELDEEPPHEVNRQALDSALSVSKLFSMNIVDQVRFMRKTVVDGSNTSGFQRTAMISSNGSLQTDNGAVVGVETICLEEDSAKAVDQKGELKTYNLSRLGIPLIEIATAPDIHHPDTVKETAEHIGMVLRSLDTVKRGLGTIRQDVNISIEKGVRVEIKGAQDLKLLPALARNEMLRQHNLLQIFEELKKRDAKVEQESSAFYLNELSSLKNSSSKVIQSAYKKKNGGVLGAKLNGFSGILGLEIQPGRRYGSELSDHAKTMGVKGLFHSDELPNYGITEDEKHELFKELDCDPDKDAFILIADDKDTARNALYEALLRAQDFSLQKSVRQALPDGTTKYMRPMPGADRMYPETDVETILIDKSNITVPELLSEKITRISKEYALSNEMVQRLIKDGIDIETLTKRYPRVKQSVLIDFFYSIPAQLKKKEGLDINTSLYQEDILSRLNKGSVTKESIPQILMLLAQGKKVNYSEYKPLSIDDVKEDIVHLVEQNKEAPMGAIIGKVMSKYKGKIDGKELSVFVKNLLSSKQ